MVNTSINKQSELSVRDTALQYARRGWWVFPLAGKIPFPKTHGHKDATCDGDQIKAFWEKYQNANIGIATGKHSGIFVVDIDIKMGKHGDESLLDLEDSYGPLPLTVECITASKGRHLYFRYPQNIEIYNSQSKIGQDIDVRGEGGYVVAPVSIVNGSSYEWEVSCHPDDIVVADAPEWLIQLVTENSQIEKFRLPDGIIPHGQQDDTLFRLACSLRAQGFPKEIVKATLIPALTKCQQDPDNPFTSKDIDRWIKSAFSYPDNNPADKSIQFFNDVWNADKFVEQYGNIIRNCEQLGGWFIWNGMVWEKDETHMITQLARQTVQSFSSMALQMTAGSKEQKAFLQHMKSSGNENKLNAMVKLAKSNDGISVLTDEFDNSPYLFNCQNGIVDLKKGCLIDHDSNCLITKICNTHFDPSAECPQWDKILYKIFIGNHQLISFIQKIVGYSLTADVSMQMFFILYGSGANGKSTLIETIYKMMGAYSMITPTSTLMVKRGGEVPNDVARLKGVRFVISSELESSKPLDEALVKKCTSNEPIPARFLHKEFFEFSPSAKIFLSTNYKPTIKGMDDGIWRHLKVILG